MKKYMIIIPFIFFSHFFAAQDTITIFFNKNGIITFNKSTANSYRKAVENDNNLWAACDYSMVNHSLLMTGTYKNKQLSIMHGHFVYFFENGNKKSEGGCLDNRWEGLWESWHESGPKKSTGKFSRGNREDEWKFWYENGLVQAEGRYSRNSKVGTWKFYDENGTLDCEEKYRNEGEFSKIWYFENEQKKTEGYFLNNKPTGEWAYWNIDEKIYLRGSYLDGKKNGEWVRNFKNGESMNILYDNGTIKGEKLGGIVRPETE